MKRLFEWIVYGLVLAASFALVTNWQTRDMLGVDGAVTIAPLALPTLSGKHAVIGPDASRNTLIYFFAPWCSVCRMSIGNLDSLNERDAQVFVVALDYNTVDEVSEFATAVGLKRDVLLGNNNLRALFKIKAYPSYYVLNSDFAIVSRDMGYSTELGLRRRIWQENLKK